MDFRQIKRAIANAFADDRYRELRVRINALEEKVAELECKDIPEMAKEYVETEAEKSIEEVAEKSVDARGGEKQSSQGGEW